MADLYVCPACGETEDCSCSRFDEAVRKVRDGREDVYRTLGRLLASLIERTPAKCSTCAAGKNTCGTCEAIHRMKKHVAEAQRA